MIPYYVPFSIFCLNKTGSNVVNVFPTFFSTFALIDKKNAFYFALSGSSALMRSVISLRSLIGFLTSSTSLPSYMGGTSYFDMSISFI